MKNYSAPWKILIKDIENKGVLITTIPSLSDLSYNQNRGLETLCAYLTDRNNQIYIWKKNVNNTIFYKNLPAKKIKKWLFKVRVFQFVIFRSNRLLIWFLRFYFKSNNILSSLRRTREKFIEGFQMAERFDVLFCWNPYCSEYGLQNDIFEFLGKDTFTIEYGPFKDSLIIDSGFIVNSQIFKNYREMMKFEELSEKWEEINLYSQPNPNIPLELTISDFKTVLILGLSEVDAGVYPYWAKERRLFYPYFKNGLHSAKSLSKLMPNVNFVFKPHPNHNKLSEDKRLSSNLWIINGDSFGLIDLADIVVANGTKLENEVLRRGKTLVNLGAGLCYYSGLSIVAYSAEDVKSIIDYNHVRKCASSILNWFKYLEMCSLK